MYRLAGQECEDLNARLLVRLRVQRGSQKEAYLTAADASLHDREFGRRRTALQETPHATSRRDSCGASSFSDALPLRGIAL